MEKESPVWAIRRIYVLSRTERIQRGVNFGHPYDADDRRTSKAGRTHESAITHFQRKPILS